jgi:hypothetical protein
VSTEHKDNPDNGRAVPKIVEMAKHAKEVSAAHRAKMSGDSADTDGVESRIISEDDTSDRQRPSRRTAPVMSADSGSGANESKNKMLIGGGIAIGVIVLVFLLSGPDEPPQTAPVVEAPVQPAQPKRDFGSEAARLAAMAAERARAAEEEAKRMRERNAEAEKTAAEERRRAAAAEAERIRAREQALAKARAEERTRLAAELETARQAETARLAAEQEALRKAEAARRSAEAGAARKAEEARLTAEAEARKAEAARVAAEQETARQAEQERAAAQVKQQELDAAEATRQAEARAKFQSVKQPGSETPAPNNSAQNQSTDTTKSGDANFSTDPCQGPSAKFLSTCR